MHCSARQRVLLHATCVKCTALDQERGQWSGSSMFCVYLPKSRKVTISRNRTHIHESHISFRQCMRHEFSVLYHSTPVTDMRLSHCIVSSGSRKHIKVTHHVFLPLFIEPSSTHSTSNITILPHPNSQTWSHAIAPYNPSTHSLTPWKYVRMPMQVLL